MARVNSSTSIGRIEIAAAMSNIIAGISIILIIAIIQAGWFFSACHSNMILESLADSEEAKEQTGKNERGKFKVRFEMPVNWRAAFVEYGEEKVMASAGREFERLFRLGDGTGNRAEAGKFYERLHIDVKGYIRKKYPLLYKGIIRRGV